MTCGLQIYCQYGILMHCNRLICPGKRNGIGFGDIFLEWNLKRLLLTKILIK